MSRNTETFTPALLAVIDGDDPESTWRPWRCTASQLREAAKHVTTPAIPERIRFSYRLQLILLPPPTLLARADWTNVIGTVIDLASVRADAQSLHDKICHHIAAVTEPLAKGVGYHLYFVLDGPPSADHEQLMTDFRAKAKDALGSKAAYVDAGMEIPSFEAFEPSLRYLERRMRQIARDSR